MKIYFIIFLIFTTIYFPQEDNSSEWYIFSQENSPLPSNNIHCMEVDIFNNVWLGTDSGLIKFDGKNWEIFHPSNSEIPFDRIIVMDSDREGDLWMSGQIEYNQSVVKYDGTKWINYTTSNSGLPSNFARAIAIDSNNISWFFNTRNDSTFLTSFNAADSSWTTYPGYFYYSIHGELMDIDSENNIWSASTYTLAKFNNLNYTFINGMFGQYPSDIKVDNSRNVWIAGGLAGWGSLVKFDGSNLTGYNHLAVSLEIDGNNLWVGTSSYDRDSNAYIAMFDGEEWFRFDVNNSPLPESVMINDLEMDQYGNL